MALSMREDIAMVGLERNRFRRFSALALAGRVPPLFSLLSMASVSEIWLSAWRNFD